MVRGGDKEGAGFELVRGAWFGREQGEGCGLKGREPRVTSGRGGAEWHILKGNWQFSLCGLSLSHT